MWGKMFEEEATLNDVTFCASWRFCGKRWHPQFPQVKNAVRFGIFESFGENSKSSTNFQDSGDVGEDVISSLVEGTPSNLPISRCGFENLWRGKGCLLGLKNQRIGLLAACWGSGDP